MNLAIKGHPKRGNEVIGRLEMLGGINGLDLKGTEADSPYYIGNSINEIYCGFSIYPYDYKIYTLEEFEEKFPYKIGDKVKSARINDFVGRIINARWDNNEEQIIYLVEWDDVTQSKLTYFAKGLQPYEEECYCQVIGNDTSSNGVNTAASLINGEIIEENINEKSFPPYMDYDITETKEQEDIEEKDEKSANHVFDTEIISFDIAQRDKYELDLQGKFKVVLRESKYYVERIKPQYPKTYKECCKVVNASPYVSLVYDRFDGKTYSYDIDNLQIYENLRKLKICRDAYWKIAGEQMGLGKVWEPDWLNTEQDKYVLFTHNNAICSNRYVLGHNILAFPTEEICNTFYENFKELIEQCKELL